MRHRITVTALGAIAAALAVATIAGWLIAGLPFDLFVETYALTNLVIGVGMGASGSLLAAFRPANPVGWLILTGSLGHLLTASLTAPIFVGVELEWPVALTRTMSTFFIAAWQLGLPGLLSLALLLFPDGHLPSRRWTPLAWAIVVTTAIQIVTGVLSGGSIGDSPAAESIVSIGLVIPELVDLAFSLIGALISLLVLVALGLRYVRGDETRRRQFFWLLLALIVILVLNSQRWLTGDGPVLLLLSSTLVPIAIAIAVLRHRLLDIRLVVSRTLLYVIASIVVIAVYAGLVAVLSLAVPTGEDRTAAIVAALVVAIGFAPLRSLLQRVVDRAFYGGRVNPERTASRLGRGLQISDDIVGVLDGTRKELHLPYLALQRDGAIVAETGAEADGGVEVELALDFGGREVGTLVVGLRPGEKTLHDDDRRVFALTTPSLAVALHATTLALELEQSRAGIVTAREEERQRLHRDLHDGLGPVLTGAAFRADAVSNVLETDPAGAKAMLSEVRDDIRVALDGVRRVVYGVRPLDLEEKGLVGALSNRAGDLRGRSGRPIHVDLAVDNDADSLPAAAQLAVYRIVIEALANISRHSDAQHATVRVVTGDAELEIRVTDDGGGASTKAWRAGAGISSIIERSAELGGSATAGPTPSGGHVIARIPHAGTATARLEPRA